MNVPSIYSEKSVLFSDLLDPAHKYTVIAGAGVSMDAPSCLLSARQIVGYLIDACCPAEEIQKLKSIDGLRYEVVIEAIEKHFDKDLNFMNFFDKFENPNVIHHFIARALLDGIGDVITTNFDYLIEYALLASIEPGARARIFPVITRPDFTRFNDMDSINTLKGEGKLPVCKVHGSKKNIITGEDTRHSLVTTMKDLGRDREGAGTFTVEPYKRPLLVNLTEGRVLLVMGYSGGDDFDIGPTLQDLVGVKSIVWINHANEIPAAGVPVREVRDEITSSDILGSVQQIDRVLGNLKLALRDKGSTTRVFRVDAPTGKLIEGIVWQRLFHGITIPNLGPPDEDAGRLDTIIKELLGTSIASDVLKWEMAGSIYTTLSMPEDAIRCFEREVELAHAIGEKEREAEALCGLALIRGSKSLFDEALQFYERALPIASSALSSKIHEGIGNIYKSIGNFKESIKNFRLALKIANQIGDDEVILNASLALSSFFRHQLKFTQALGLLQNSMKLVDKIGDLPSKSVILSEIALIHSSQQDYNASLNLNKEVLKISEILRDEQSIAMVHGNIANDYLRTNRYDEALEHIEQCRLQGKHYPHVIAYAHLLKGWYYEDAKQPEKAVIEYEEHLRITKEINNISNFAGAYMQLGNVYAFLEKNEDAIDYYKVSIEYTDQTRDLTSRMRISISLLRTYDKVGKYDDAIEVAKNALAIAEELERNDPEAPLIDSVIMPKGAIRYLRRFIGKKLKGKKNFHDALDYLMQLLPFPPNFYNAENQAEILENIGYCNYKLGKHNIALEYYTKASECIDGIENRIDRLDREIGILRYFGIIHKDLGEHDVAMDYTKRALKIAQGLFDENGHNDDFQRLATCYNDMALLFEKLERFDDAIECYNKANKLSKDIVDHNNAAIFLDNIARLYYDKGNNHEAISNFMASANEYAEAGMLKEEVNEWQMVGNAHHNLKEFDKAIECYKKGMAIAIEQGFNDDEITATSNIGGSYWAAKNFDLAVELFTKSIMLCEIAGDIERQAKYWLNLGRVHIDSGNLDRAIEPLKFSAETYMRIDKKREAGVVYYFLGNSLRKLARYEDAIKAHRMELEISRDINSPEDIVGSLARLGNSYNGAGMHAEALEIQLDYMGKAKEFGLEKDYATSHWNVALAYKGLKNWEKAIGYFEMYYDIYEKMNDLTEMEDALNSIADIYYNLDKEKAIEIYLRRVAVNRERKHLAGEEDALRYVAKMHFDLERYDVSAEYYLKGVEIARMRGDDGMVAEGYSNAAYSLFKGGKVDESISLYEHSIDVRERIGAFKELVDNYNRLGLIYNDAKDYEKSLSYFEKKLNATVKVGDKEKIFDVYYDLGLIANRVPRYDLAIEYFHKGIEIATALGNESAVAGMQEGLAKALTATGRYDDAIEAWNSRLTICEKFKDVKNRASTLEGLALTRSKAGHHEAAARLYERAAIDRSGLGEDPYPDYMNAGRTCIQAGHAENATWQFETALALVQSRDDKSRSSDALHELAIALEHSGRFSEAIDRLTKEIDFRADLKDEAGLQSARDAIEAIKQRADAEMRDATSKPGEEGWSLMSEDSSPAGLHRALAAAESLQKPHAIAEIASKLGMHYHEGKHSDMAIRFFEKSLNAYRLLGDIKNVKNQVVQISACLRAREQYNDAIARLEDALRIIDENSAFFDDKTRFEIKYEIGDIFYLKKDWDGATKVFDEALAIARSASDPDQLKRAYHAIAFTLAKGGRKKEAIEYYEAELKMAQDGGMLEQQGFCWNEIGALHSQLDDHKRALECYEREMECYRKAGDTKNVNLSKRNMGNALWWLDDKNKAIDMYKEVLAEAKELNDLDLVFDTLDDLGGLFRQQRQFSDALTAYQEELDLATKNENKQRIRQSYRGFGRVNFDMENYMVAIDFFSREEQLCLALNDMVNRQDALKYIGKVYGQSGRAYDGVSYYLQAADINKRLGNWNDVGQCYFSAATVNRNAKLLEKAQEYYAQALMFFEKAGNKKEMNNVLGNMAMTYYENKNFEQQIKHFEQALQLCIDNGLIDLAKNRAKDLAASYEELPDKQGYEKSIEFYLLHSHLSKDIDDPNGVIGGIIGASNKLFELGRHEESIKHLESAKSFLHQANNLKREWELFQMLGISYRQLHRYDVAKQCLDHAIEIAYRNADLSDVAWTKGSLAKLHVMHGRVQDALALRLEAIEKLDQTPVEKYPDKFKELAMHHEEIGEYYRDLGDDSKSTFAKRQVKWFKMLAEDVKQEKQCTEKIDDGIKDIFTEIREAGMKVTFLVGAGISMNPPSSLASAREIVRDLLELCVPPDEIDAILDLPNLRYETIVEHIQDMFDKELRFMDYFESVKDPNAIHITLAQAILNNHDVVTTNFDYLIEHGLIVLLNNKGLSPDKITPVITKSDFMRWSDPGKKRQDGGGLLPLFKIHGSSKNIMTGDNTKESLITTISALGKGKETSGTFSIEPFKKPAINALMRDRCLIVLGYSGNDDFDIGPFLKELPDLRRIIWINHTTAGSNVLYKVKKLADASIWENNRGIYPLLSEIRHDVGYDVYRLNVHTERFVKEYLWPLMSPGEPIPLTLSSEPQEGRKGFKESVGHLFSGVSLLDRLFFAIRIFSSVNDVAGFKRTVERALSVAKQNGDNMMMAKLIEKKVSILYDENDLESCMREYEEASALYSQLGMLKDYANVLADIGVIHANLGNFDIAMVKFDEALSIAEEVCDDELMASLNHSMGFTYLKMDSKVKAYDHFQNALTQVEKHGNLQLKANILGQIGSIYHARGQYEKEMELLNEAYQISVNLGDLISQSQELNNIGRNYKKRGLLAPAKEKYHEAMKIARDLNYQEGIAMASSNLSMLLLDQEQFEESLKFTQIAENIFRKGKFNTNLITVLGNKSMIYFHWKKYKDAYDISMEALRLAEEAKLKHEVDRIKGNLRDIMKYLT